MEEYVSIHHATALNHAAFIRNILLNHIELLEQRDENGDQPAHIASRLGNIETLRVLIEFDAPMEIRNYNLLTPIGEARMNQQEESIRLLRDNYIFSNQSESIITSCLHLLPPLINGTGERYVYRRIDPSIIPSQTIHRAATRRLK